MLSPASSGPSVDWLPVLAAAFASANQPVRSPRQPSSPAPPRLLHWSPAPPVLHHLLAATAVTAVAASAAIAGSRYRRRPHRRQQCAAVAQSTSIISAAPPRHGRRRLPPHYHISPWLQWLAATACLSQAGTRLPAPASPCPSPHVATALPLRYAPAFPALRARCAHVARTLHARTLRARCAPRCARVVTALPAALHACYAPLPLAPYTRTHPGRRCCGTSIVSSLPSVAADGAGGGGGRCGRRRHGQHGTPGAVALVTHLRMLVTHAFVCVSSGFCVF